MFRISIFGKGNNSNNLKSSLQISLTRTWLWLRAVPEQLRPRLCLEDGLCVTPLHSGPCNPTQPARVLPAGAGSSVQGLCWRGDKKSKNPDKKHDCRRDEVSHSFFPAPANGVANTELQTLSRCCALRWASHALYGHSGSFRPKKC